MRLANRHDLHGSADAMRKNKRKDKRMAGFMRCSSLCIALSTCLLLSGCGGYAREAGSNSGIEVFGTIDASVQHEQRSR